MCCRCVFLTCVCEQDAQSRYAKWCSAVCVLDCVGVREQTHTRKEGNQLQHRQEYERD